MEAYLLKSRDNFNKDLLTIWKIFKNKYSGCLLIINPGVEKQSGETEHVLVQLFYNQELGRLVIEISIA